MFYLLLQQVNEVQKNTEGATTANQGDDGFWTVLSTIIGVAIGGMIAYYSTQRSINLQIKSNETQRIEQNKHETKIDILLGVIDDMTDLIRNINGFADNVLESKPEEKLTPRYFYKVSCVADVETIKKIKNVYSEFRITKDTLSIEKLELAEMVRLVNAYKKDNQRLSGDKKIVYDIVNNPLNKDEDRRRAEVEMEDFKILADKNNKRIDKLSAPYNKKLVELVLLCEKESHRIMKLIQESIPEIRKEINMRGNFDHDSYFSDAKVHLDKSETMETFTYEYKKEFDAVREKYKDF